jgi:hypothetical protein
VQLSWKEVASPIMQFSYISRSIVFLLVRFHPILHTLDVSWKLHYIRLGGIPPSENSLQQNVMLVIV